MRVILLSSLTGEDARSFRVMQAVDRQGRGSLDLGRIIPASVVNIISIDPAQLCGAILMRMIFIIIVDVCPAYNYSMRIIRKKEGPSCTTLHLQYA